MTRGPGDPPAAAGGKTKPRVLVFGRCYLPGFRGGGPVRSLANLVQALGPEIDFRIITLDRDLPDGPPYESVRPGRWHVVGEAEVLYLPRQEVSMRRLALEVAEWSPHAIYLNSFFDGIFTVKVLLARRFGWIPPVPALLAPQGEFSSGALGLKTVKKAVYIRLARMGGLYRGLIWQASNEAERRDILQTLQSVRSDDVRVAADLTDEVPDEPPVRGRTAPGILRVCFLSRITPKKNLDFALRVLADVTAQVQFTIYGPIEDSAYWATCQAAMARLPANVQARYAGEVLPVHVRRTLGEHDVFFFPTRGENFGHVIFEALSAGLPVLISDQTPWHDVEAHGAGRALPLQSVSEFARAVDEMSRRHPAEREGLAERALAYARRCVDRPAAVRRVSALFQDLVHR